MEIIIFEILEFRPRGRKQLCAAFNILIHGTTDVEQQQYFDRVAALWHLLDLQKAPIVRGRADGVVEIQLKIDSGPGKLSQASKGHLHITGPQLDVGIIILILPELPDLQCRLLSRHVGGVPNALAWVLTTTKA